MTTAKERIAELERHLVRGDIARASETVSRIHDCWNAFDAATQKDIRKLEAIYLSLVQQAVGSKRAA